MGERAGLTIPEFAAAYPAEHAAWAAAGGSFEHADAVPGAESTADVLGRIVPALREVLDSVPPGGTACVVGHGAALKVATIALLGWDRTVSTSLRGLDNCGHTLLDDAGPDGVVATRRVEPDPRFRAAGVGWLIFCELSDGVRSGGRPVGGVAQLVAHLHGMQRVRGSSPLTSTDRVRPGPQGPGLDDDQAGPVRARPDLSVRRPDACGPTRGCGIRPTRPAQPARLSSIRPTRVQVSCSVADALETSRSASISSVTRRGASAAAQPFVVPSSRT